MKLINFGKVDKKILIPILGGIFRMIFKYILSLNPKNKIAIKNPFILSIYMSIGMILAFIPYLIIKYRTKEKGKIFFINDNHGKKYTFIYENENIKLKKRKKRKYIYILLSVFLDFSLTILLLVFSSNCPYNFWIFDIIFISIFSYFILKKKLERHQVFSMVFIIILGFALNVITYFKLDDDNKGIKILDLSLKILSEICLSLNVVVAKYNMEINYVNAYEVCIWEGIMGLLLYIICLIIINASELTIDDIKYPDNLYELVNNIEINDFIVFFMYILLNFVYNVSLLLTCTYFTPCHILIIHIINECYLYFKMKNDLLLNISGLVIVFLIFISFLFFIEILELNICDISKNTKKNIEIRADSDFLDESISIFDDSSEAELGIS